MSKAKVFIEIEIEINRKDDPNDKNLGLSEIAENACDDICCTIYSAADKNKRKTKISSAKYEYTISKTFKRYGVM
jgi:hypothetical protein